MEERLMRLEMALLLEDARRNHNQPKMNKIAKEAALLAQRMGTAEAAYTAGIIRDLEVESRRYKKKGRFSVKSVY